MRTSKGNLQNYPIFKSYHFLGQAAYRCEEFLLASVQIVFSKAELYANLSIKTVEHTFLILGYFH